MTTDRTVIEYSAEIERRALALIDSGDLDAITAHMPTIESDRYRYNIRVICTCRTSASREHAIAEIRELIFDAAKRAAQVQYHDEMQIGARKQAIDRYYTHAGVPREQLLRGLPQ